MFARMKRSLQSLAIGLLLSACSGGNLSPPDGAALFARHCSACHGQSGEGDGPVAAVMQVTVPNLRSLSERSGGRFPRDAVLAYIDGRDLPASHGDRYMPVWGNVFQWSASESAESEQEVNERIAAITDFLEQIQN
jgi:mono/diheme cytochrome c family protein